VTADLLISAGPGEVRGALVEAGRLVEIMIERPGQGSLVGDLFVARVSRVLPGMAAAFLDLGGGQTAFLPRSEAIHADALRIAPTRAEAPVSAAKASVSQLVNEGDALVVQVARDAVGGKQARATTKITIVGHHLILTPTQDGVGVSRRIRDAAERERLTEILGTPGGGLVARTAAAGTTEEVLEAEAASLRQQWQETLAEAQTASAPAVLGGNPDPVARILQVLASGANDRTIVEGAGAMAAVRRYAARFQPTWADRIEAAAGSTPLFDAEGVEEQIERALEPRVALPSGGDIVIETTEALTVVDVNTAGHTTGGDMGRTVLETNIEAAEEIARQLRLRAVAGLVVVDFVRMERPEARRQVLSMLGQAVRADPQPVRVGAMTPFGLVEITRKRSRQPLVEVLTGACSACAGSGRIRTPLTVSLEALRASLRAAATAPGRAPVIVGAAALIDCLEGVARPARAEAEATLSRGIVLRRDEKMPPDRYEVVLE